ncbi:MAG: D-apionate lactonase, partial [Alphaproteobacteria bacterium]
GKEALRGIAFLVRDRNWGTYNPDIANLVIHSDEARFTVTYDAVCRDDTQEFRYSASIEGRADGSLKFEADCQAMTDVLTNRTGFVVLHALEGVVGEPVTVEHVDGRVIDSHFPEQINPACPFQAIRALTHQIMPGVKVTCRMEGDAFEMEDHRNWMDASYKTYVRPLALPWPYTIPGGEKSRQSVTLSLDGTPAAAAAAGADEITVNVGAPSGHKMPRIGLAAPAEHVDAALAKIDILKAAGAQFLICHFDPRKGHDAKIMQAFAKLGEALNAELVLEAIVPCLDTDGNPTADTDVLARDMAAIGKAAEGVAFSRVAVSPASDLKCTLPGSTFPPAPGWADLFATARQTFPSASVGGGMFSYFTELNRKRPPADALDFIGHSGCPIVHAGDDISMTETLESLPSIFGSVRAFAGGKPYWVFPTAISMRDNPYGAAPAENPGNIRQSMNRVDPRERGLIGAAWYAGYLAHAANAGIDSVTLGAVAGPSGIACSKGPHAQPWFDTAGAAVYPHFHVIGGHAHLTGTVRGTAISDPRTIQALAVSQPDGDRLWVCNLTGSPQSVRISGIPGPATMLVLDADTFEAACADENWHDSAPTTVFDGTRTLQLRPYAVAELRFPS